MCYESEDPKRKPCCNGRDRENEQEHQCPVSAISRTVHRVVSSLTMNHIYASYTDSHHITHVI